MKSLKKLIAMAVAIALTSSWLLPGSMVSAVNEGYRQGSVTEDFETITAEELQAGVSTIVRGFTNNGTVAVTDLLTNGKKLDLEPAEGSSDTSMLTKPGLFPYDVTVVEVFLSITATKDSGRAACVTLRKNSDSSYSQLLLDFNGGMVRNGLDSSKNVSQTAGCWYQVQFVFDRPDQTISVSVLNTAAASASATVTADWGDDAYLQFQALQMLQIDDITISDGFYLENDVYNEDFEHIQSLSVNQAMLGFSRASVTTQGVMENENNTYLSVTATANGATFYTTGNTGIQLTAGKPGVIQFRLKVDAGQTFTTGLRTNSGTYIPFVSVTNGIVSFGTASPTTFDATDGEFHTYRIKITPLTEGGCASALIVDNIWLGSQTYSTTVTNGARWDFRFPVSDTVALLDDFQICYPQAAAVRETSESVSGAVSFVPSEVSLAFEANNPINYSTLNASSFTLTAEDQTTVPVAVTTVDDKTNTFVLQPQTFLAPETTYTFSFVDNVVKELYDQYFSGTLCTFTTIAATEPVYTTLNYIIDGTTGDGESFSNGALSLQLDVLATTDTGANVVALAGLYDDVGILTGVTSVRLTLDAAGSDSQTSESITIDDTVERVKLFLWDGSTLAPMQSSMVFTRAGRTEAVQ